MMRCLLFLFPGMLQAQALQLSAPKISADNPFFTGSTTVKMAFDLEGASIHYSLRSSATNSFGLYHKPFSIRKSTIVRAYATHPDYRQSLAVEKRFVRVEYVPETVQLKTAAHGNYPGKGASSLCDLKKGSADLHDGNWLGFLGDTVEAKMTFRHRINCKNLLISSLYDLNAWIGPMKKIVVEAKNRKGKWQEIGKWQSAEADAAPGTPGYPFTRSLKLRRVKSSQFRVVVTPFGPLPIGHAGAGTPAWLFIDEIVFQ